MYNSKTTYDSGFHPIIILSFFWGFCFFYFNGHPLFNDYDTAWHIAAGDLIRQLGHLPKTNYWAFSAVDTIWYNISWLWDVIISLIAQYLGLNSLYYFNALFYALILAAVSYGLVIRNCQLSAIAITVLILTIVLWNQICLRPYSYSFLMIVLFQAFLYQYNINKKLIYLLILPVMMVSWVNIHGGFIGGFILIGAYGLSALANQSWKEVIFLAITGILCLVSALINPYGIDIYRGICSTTASAFTAHIDEWRKFAFGSDWTITLYLFLFLITFNIREKSIYLADRILAIIWLIAGFMYVRNMPIFALCSAPFIAGNLSASGILRKLPDINTSKLRVCSFITVVVLIAVMITPQISSRIITKDIIANYRLPINLVKFIKEKYPKNNFLNDYGLGAYLIYHTRGEIPVFIDGRAGTAYPEEVLNDYLLLGLTLPNLNDYILLRHHINGVIAYSSKPKNMIFANKSGWKQVFVDNNFTVYVKK
jgi:hypothetical protein